VADRWAAWLHAQQATTQPNAQRPFHGLGARRTTGQRLAAATAPRPALVDARHLAWQADAACRGTDPEAFFTDTEPTTTITALCNRCPVRDICLDYAVSHHVAGIWAGTTDNQRRHIRAAQRHAANA
jgi:WhiB family redox-sensing transcriptional regulator